VSARPKSLALAAPLTALLMLGGVVLERKDHLAPAQVEVYHAKARALVEAFPHTIGFWTGSDYEITRAAQKLLRPNAIVSRRYVENHTDRASNREAQLLIVQCRDTRDMLGHYPPVCYPAHGMTQIDAQPREWTLGDLPINGMEYSFVRRRNGTSQLTTVYSFFVVPTRNGRDAIRPDMSAIRAAAEDYQQRHFGAAQFQMKFDGDSADSWSRAERDEVFAALFEPAVPVIRMLSIGALP
jgi:hypothetical protein